MSDKNTFDKNARTPIHSAVEKTRAGENPFLITQLETCWVVASDLPFQPGHCVALADPVVFSINDLDEDTRMRYSRDVCRIGDALIKVMGSYRINYETMCNGAQSLHTHIVPRYLNESDDKLKERPAISYPLASVAKFVPADHAEFMEKMRAALSRFSR